ncbi:MAG: hypothetical protein R3Y23_02635 [Bacillota bacterium]
MTINDIIDRVAQIVGIDETDIAEGSAIQKKLISATNMIYLELTMQYVHLKTKEEVAFEDNRLYYDTLSFPVREVLGVRSRGHKLDFTTYPLYIECKNCDSAEVTYIYFTDELESGDEVVLPPKFTAYTLALGVASEYYYRLGLIDEALFYKTRYDNAISNLNIGLKCGNLPQRKFLG